jgi:Na+/melibiose symporter-like transporter
VSGAGLSTEELVTILFVSLVGPTLLMMPLWVALARRFGKRDAYGAAILCYALGSSLMWLAQDAPLWVACAAAGTLGIGFAGTQLLAFSMLPDPIQAEHTTSGERRDGIFSGVWLAADKGGIAVGSFFASLVLALTGFIESHELSAVAQPVSALTGIALNASLFPALLMLSSLLVLRRYHLTQNDLRAH